METMQYLIVFSFIISIMEVFHDRNRSLISSSLEQFNYINSRSSSSQAEEKHAAHYVFKLADMQTQYADEPKVASSYAVACYIDASYMDACYAV